MENTGATLTKLCDASQDRAAMVKHRQNQQAGIVPHRLSAVVLVRNLQSLMPPLPENQTRLRLCAHTSVAECHEKRLDGLTS